MKGKVAKDEQYGLVFYAPRERLEGLSATQIAEWMHESVIHIGSDPAELTWSGKPVVYLNSISPEGAAETDVFFIKLYEPPPNEPPPSLSMYFSATFDVHVPVPVGSMYHDSTEGVDKVYGGLGDDVKWWEDGWTPWDNPFLGPAESIHEDPETPQERIAQILYEETGVPIDVILPMIKKHLPLGG